MKEQSFLEKSVTVLRNQVASLHRAHQSYRVPSVWIAGNGEQLSTVNVQPAEFFLAAVENVLAAPMPTIKKGVGGSWTRDAVIFNMFLRTTCAFDHNQNGKLDLALNADGWRETGTFLKAIAVLLYIHSLGANTVHLLPITSIGSDGNKGTLGSPYAIKNPYHIDENLSEPNLGFGVEDEFKLFVEAAHHLGMRVVVEFVFRTSSKDGDWVKEHPDWYYWIKESVADRPPGSHDESQYGNPIFTAEELKNILAAVENRQFHHLPPPHQSYRSMFTLSPPKESVHLEKGKYIGTTTNGTRTRIPGAFADWPPDDTQPPWKDVTYLKMYDHADFNYIAYNTIRMYDERLATKQNINQSLWETISEIVPHYQKQFGIDGVMIDMGHALPMELKQEMIRRARTIDPDFAFWDENFSITEKSVQEGYNAVFGYQWSDQHKIEKFKTMLKRFSEEGFALPFFATPESHNTPRAAARKGGMVYSRYAWAISNFIPATPFLHSGFELGETYPINTGLDFTKEDLARFPSEKLPLFSEYAYDWLNSKNMISWVRHVSSVRKKYHDLITNPDPDSFQWVETNQKNTFAFKRKSPQAKRQLLLVANGEMESPVEISIPLESHQSTVEDLLDGKQFPVSHGTLTISLQAGQVAVFEL